MKRKLQYILGFVFLVVLVVGGIMGYRVYARCHDAVELIEAIESENVEKVEELLQNGVDPNTATLPNSRIWSFFEMGAECPLSVACNNGNLEIVKLLIAHGASANGVESAGFSPLEEVLFYFHPDDVEIVSLLLENGATVEEDAVFQAAQMFPCVYDKTKENGTVFKEGYDENTAIGITKIVEMLLSGRLIDCTTASGQTILMLGIQRENLYLTEYLIAEGCDLSIADVNGKTALDYAQETQNEILISIIMGAT